MQPHRRYNCLLRVYLSVWTPIYYSFEATKWTVVTAHEPLGGLWSNQNKLLALVLTGLMRHGQRDSKVGL